MFRSLVSFVFFISTFTFFVYTLPLLVSVRTSSNLCSISLAYVESVLNFSGIVFSLDERHGFSSKKLKIRFAPRD